MMAASMGCDEEQNVLFNFEGRRGIAVNETVIVESQLVFERKYRMKLQIYIKISEWCCFSCSKPFYSIVIDKPKIEL